MSEEFDKDGFLAKRFGSKPKARRLGKPKWHVYYFNLIGGSLYFYKEAEVSIFRTFKTTTIVDTR
jgi:hypothetical protein